MKLTSAGLWHKGKEQQAAVHLLFPNVFIKKYVTAHIQPSRKDSAQ
jgi:hypothetical protein